MRRKHIGHASLIFKHRFRSAITTSQSKLSLTARSRAVNGDTSICIYGKRHSFIRIRGCGILQQILTAPGRIWIATTGLDGLNDRGCFKTIAVNTIFNSNSITRLFYTDGGNIAI